MSSATWSRAWRDAARGFWAREEPHHHFTTSATPALADRIASIVHEVDARLGHPDTLTVIDIGCGDGSLLALVRERCTDVGSRARWIGVDLRPARMEGIDAVVAEVPCPLLLGAIHGVVMAHEWLDEMPCDVVTRDEAGVDRLVLVDQRGIEMHGPALDDADGCAALGVDAARTRSWLEQWWPLRAPGDRAEVGTLRDQAWAWMAGLLSSGTALATDYGHVRSDRIARDREGTLTAYRMGRLVRPVPDGTANLTAHVAVDACADAVPGTTVTVQRQEIAPASLGPQPSMSEVDGYFATLRLRDPARLGSVHWLRWDAHRLAPVPASTLPTW